MEGVDQDRTGMGNIEGTARTAGRAGRESKQVQKGGKLGAVEQNQGSKVPEGLALPSARKGPIERFVHLGPFRGLDHWLLNLRGQ